MVTSRPSIASTFSVLESPWEGGRPGKDGNFWREAVYIEETKKTEVMQQVNQDIGFLKAHGLMDYSLILRVETMSLCDAKKKIVDVRPDLAQTFKTSSSLFEHGGFLLSIRRGIVYAYSFGFIDLLQRWVSYKEAAQVNFHFSMCASSKKQRNVVKKQISNSKCRSF